MDAVGQDNIDTEREFSFPYRPYSIQNDLMNAIYNAVSRRRIGFFESPTGTGKTLSLICSLLQWQEDALECSAEADPEQDCTKNDGTAELDWLLEYDKKVEAIQRSYSAEMKKEHRKELTDRVSKHRAGLSNLHQYSSSNSPFRSVRRRKAEQMDAEAISRSSLDDQQELENDLFWTRSRDEADYVPDFVQQLKEEMLLSRRDAENAGLTEGLVDSSPEVLASFRPKIFYVSRTHSQVSQFIQEIKKTRFWEATRVVPLGGRQYLCLNKEVLRLRSNDLISDACQKLLNANMHDPPPPNASLISEPISDSHAPKRKKEKLPGCPFAAKRGDPRFLLTLLSQPRDIEDAKKIGNEEMACSFFGTRSAHLFADIIALPYQTILRKKARDAIGIDLTDSIVVIDEAHNVIDAVLDAHTYSLTTDQLFDTIILMDSYIHRYGTRFSLTNLAMCFDLYYSLVNLHSVLLPNSFLWDRLKYTWHHIFAIRTRLHNQKFAAFEGTDVLNASPKVEMETSLPMCDRSVLEGVQNAAKSPLTVETMHSDENFGLSLEIDDDLKALLNNDILEEVQPPQKDAADAGKRMEPRALPEALSEFDELLLSVSIDEDILDASQQLPKVIGKGAIEGTGGETSIKQAKSLVDVSLTPVLPEAITLEPHVSLPTDSAAASSTRPRYSTEVDPPKFPYSPSSERISTPTLTLGELMHKLYFSRSVASSGTTISSYHQQISQSVKTRRPFLGVNSDTPFPVPPIFDLTMLLEWVSFYGIARKMKFFVDSEVKREMKKFNVEETDIHVATFVPNSVARNVQGKVKRAQIPLSTNVKDSLLAQRIQAYIEFESQKDGNVDAKSSNRTDNMRNNQVWFGPEEEVAITTQFSKALTDIMEFFSCFEDDAKSGKFFRTIVPNTTTFPTVVQGAISDSSPTLLDAPSPNSKAQLSDGDNVMKHYYFSERTATIPTFSLQYSLIDPSGPFQDIVQNARSVVLIGGTMSPVSDMLAQLLPDAKQSQRVDLLFCQHVIPASHVLCSVLSATKTGVLFDFRQASRTNLRMVQALGDALIDIAKSSPAGMVVFLPSYDYMSFLSQTWKTQFVYDNTDTGYESLSGATRKTGRLNILQALNRIKRVFFESSNSSESDSIFKAYSEVISSQKALDAKNIATGLGTSSISTRHVTLSYEDPSRGVHRHAEDGVGNAQRASTLESSGALLFSVMGGKLSEGINFSDDLARTVVVVGLPYPNPKDPVFQERMQYMNKMPIPASYKKLSYPTAAEAALSSTTAQIQQGPVEKMHSSGTLGQEYYVNVTMRKVNQSIGRAFRHVNDFASIILIDDRYTTPLIMSKLPKWLSRDMKQHSCTESLCKDIGIFFANKS